VTCHHSTKSPVFRSPRRSPRRPLPVPRRRTAGSGRGRPGSAPPPFHASRRVRDGVLRRFTAEMDPHAACRVLGVPPGASEADVKSAYRNAAMKFHPDRNAGLGADAERVAAERFRRASEAYDVLSHRGGASGGSSSSRYASHARRPPSGGGHSDRSSQRKSGYYNGASDPFGFRYKRSDRVGDHMRRIDGNIRALYATLALVGVALYLAPQPSSPAETARRRRKSGADRSTRAFVERAAPSLAPGSPLDSNERTKAFAFEGTRVGTNATSGGTSDLSRRTREVTNERHVRDVRHAFDDTRSNDDATFRYAYGGGGEMRAPPYARRDELVAYGSAGERAFAEARTRALEEARGDEDVDAVANAPEWARGGYAGRGVSRRVLPYRRRRFQDENEDENGDGDGDGDGDAASGIRAASGIACARCHCALPLTARFCSICGARVTSPASVVATAAGTRAATESEPKRKPSIPRATPLADPQDTGSSAGRGRARAVADRELNAGAEAG